MEIIISLCVYPSEKCLKRMRAVIVIITWHVAFLRIVIAEFLKFYCFLKAVRFLFVFGLLYLVLCVECVWKTAVAARILYSKIQTIWLCCTIRFARYWIKDFKKLCACKRFKRL